MNLQWSLFRTRKADLRSYVLRQSSTSSARPLRYLFISLIGNVPVFRRKVLYRSEFPVSFLTWLSSIYTTPKPRTFSYILLNIFESFTFTGISTTSPWPPAHKTPQTDLRLPRHIPEHTPDPCFLIQMKPRVVPSGELLGLKYMSQFCNNKTVVDRI